MLDKSLYVVDNSDITSIVTTSYFIILLINMYNDLPLLRQFFLIPKLISLWTSHTVKSQGLEQGDGLAPLCFSLVLKYVIRHINTDTNNTTAHKSP
jgi:hypothetical protein